jgi:hypothetical protein
MLTHPGTRLSNPFGWLFWGAKYWLEIHCGNIKKSHKKTLFHTAAHFSGSTIDGQVVLGRGN